MRSIRLAAIGITLVMACTTATSQAAASGPGAESVAHAAGTDRPTGATGGSGTYGDLPGSVVYQTLNGDHDSLWLIQPDGSDAHLLLGADHTTVHPRWSFDGDHLIFTDCAVDPGCTLTIVDADGSDPVVAYECGACYGGDGASLSPDGVLAFTRYFGGDPTVEAPSHAALTVGPPGGPFVALTSLQQLPAGLSDQFPRWSPDGTHLVFFREKYRKGEIVATAVYTIAADGTDLERLTPWSLHAGNPDWSTDGSSIAFNSDPIVDFGSGPSDIYTVRPNGSHLRRITHFAHRGYRADQPTFADGGDVIFFTLQTAGSTKQLWAMRREGTATAQITTTGLYTHAQLQPR
jgi:Tol biopolymer transport system component